MSRRARALRALEPVALLAVPAVAGLCAYLQLSATGGLVLLVTLLCLALFFASYEASRPALRQILPTATLGAVAAAGRILFAPVPDVKPVSAIAIVAGATPVSAIAIVAGATLGRQSGFMVGAIAALVSNFFFGQGAWTPMQMYAWGLVGYLAGVLADAGALRRGWVLYAYGAASGLLYGLLLNGWYVLGYVRPLAWQTVLAAFALALPLDVTHSAATVGFLAAIWLPWRRAIRRVVAKYGLR